MRREFLHSIQPRMPTYFLAPCKYASIKDWHDFCSLISVFIRSRESDMFKKSLAAVFATLLATGSAYATLVATISGQYGDPSGDTPNLFIHNTTGFDFTSVTLTGFAYQGSNALLPSGTQVDQPDGVGGVYTRTQVRTLSDIVAGTTLTYSFEEHGKFCGPSAFTGDYFIGDYDDSYGCTTAAQPGNVLFTFSAMWNGQPIFSQFSPTTNATGGFLGFLGLDQNGFAETSFDNGGAVSGTGQFGELADIFVGQAPPPSGAPEPATLMLFGLGLAGLGFNYRKRA